MIPSTICLENCDELIEDWRRRLIGAEAREFAEKGLPPRKLKDVETYWGQIIRDHEKLYWMDCYSKRVARLARMKK